MKASERNLLLIVGGLALAMAFWFLILSPKRKESSKLGDEITQLQQEVDAQQQRAVFAQDAKDQFNANYSKVVVLGKAAPDNADTPSFLIQLNALADRAKVDFNGLTLVPGEGASTAAAQPGIDAAPPASSQPSTTAPPAESGAAPADTSTASATTAPVATEAAASSLPIGAGVGPAGLSTLKYKLSFSGDYFQLAKFMASVDRLVSSSGGKVFVNGRLSTIDGFALKGEETAAEAASGKSVGKLSAELAVTTYTSPGGQTLGALATPSGPSASLPGSAPQLAASAGTTP